MDELYEKIKQANETIRTTNVKGKEYAEVNQRIKAFRMVYPDGFIQTETTKMSDDVCIMRASVGRYDEHGDAYILGTGTAYEVQGSSLVNETSYIENCVPIDSQILTKQGWKFYYQLQLGEDVLSLNIDTGELEFTPLEGVHVYEDRPIIEMSTSRFKARCTPEHKWIVKSQYEPLTRIQTKDLTSTWKIVQSVKQHTYPSKIGKALGWLMCDCKINSVGGMASTGYINQSKYVEEVSKIFGEGRKTKKYNDEWLDNYEWIVPASKVRSILGHFGMATYKDLPSAMACASIEDVSGCYESMMLADGSNRGFSSTYPELIEAMQIMCARLGLSTTFITERFCEKSTKPIYTLGIKKTNGAWFSEMKVKNLPPQDVWCPTTKNGTWIMRQNGFVTVTSNCETSAVGRALGMAGFGIDTSVASAEEVGGAIRQQAERKATEKQIKAIKKLYGDEFEDEYLKNLSIEQASTLIRDGKERCYAWEAIAPNQ